MQNMLRGIVVVLALLGWLAAGMLGTETRLLLYWPAVVLLGLAATVMPCSGRWPLASTPSPWCLAISLLFAVYLVLRSVFSPVTVYAREDLFLVLGCYVTYLFSATCFSNPGLRKSAFTILLLVIAGNLAAGYVHFSGHPDFHLVPGLKRLFGEDQRIGGLFNNANHLAAFLTTTSLLLMGVVLFGKINLPAKMLLSMLVVLSVAAVSLTQSRGGMVALAAGCAVLLLLAGVVLRCACHCSWLKLAVGGTAIAFAAVLVFAGLFAAPLYGRVNSLPERIAQADPRLFIWRAALDQFQQSPHPAVGVGSRLFYEGCITYRTADTPRTLKDAQFAHNDWLQLLTEYGWAGLLLAMTAVLVHAWHGFSCLLRYTDEAMDFSSLPGSAGAVVGSMAALAAVLIHALLDFHFHVPAAALLASALFGVLANPGTTAHALPTLPGLRPALKMGLIASGAMMIYGATFFGRSDYHLTMALMQNKEDGQPNRPAQVEFLDQAIALDPDNFTTWYERGLLKLETASGQPVSMAQSQLASATADLQKAWELNPYNVFIVLALADAYDATGKADQALESIRRGIALAPTSMAPRLSLAIHWHRHQQWQQAEEAYQWAMQATAHESMDAYDLYQQMLRDAAN